MKQHKFCCGNDLGEGGHRYGDDLQVGNPPNQHTIHIPAAIGDADAGNFEPNSENICNDYISGNQASDISGWIDNDCDGDANCKDNSCKGDRGPQGGICCKIPNDCTSTLEEEVGYIGCNLGTGWECDCLSVPGRGDTANGWYRELDYDKIKTCLASNLEAFEEDRFIKINGLEPGRTYSVNIKSETELNGNEGNCTGKILFSIFKNRQKIVNHHNSYPGLSIDHNNDLIVIGFINEAIKDCIVELEIT